MFTVKHTSSSYQDTIYSAREVRFNPSTSGPNQTPTPETVWLSGGDSWSDPLTDGTVYVMNDNGATVAKYDLSVNSRTQTGGPVG